MLLRMIAHRLRCVALSTHVIHTRTRAAPIEYLAMIHHVLAIGIPGPIELLILLAVGGVIALIVWLVARTPR